ncbi:hypothetical protein LTR86_002997 [Recurvomyces mirabilis]|nr:hypothetical protein LTR86_002997 [Recurvomyces mirabilis]
MTTQDEDATAPSQPTSDIIPPSSDAPAPSSPSPVKTSQPDTSTPAPPNPRLTALATKKATLEQTLADLQAQRSAIVAQTTLPSGLAMPADWNEEQRTRQALTGANSIIKEHIALLHKYNEMKDIGQGLMGLIAEQRGVRVSEVMEDFDMGRKD